MEISTEGGQKLKNEWFDNMPAEVEKLYSSLSAKVKKFQTFDLLSNISYYNHLHDTETYTDSRGDKHFFVPEVLALLCLKNQFINESIVIEENYQEVLKEIQDTVLNYCLRKSILDSKINRKEENTVSNVTSLLIREAKNIRNPGLPDHHLIFAEKLFSSIKDELKNLFGFSISDSVTIRKLLSDLINKKYNDAATEVLKKAKTYSNEIIQYKKTKTVGDNSIFTKEQLVEYSLLSNKRIKEGVQNHLLNELHFTLSKIYTFTEEELSDYTKIDINSVREFLNHFSCGFPSLNKNDEIYAPVTILKTKPILKHNEQYLVPSIPLLTWAVEEVVEAEIKRNQKLNNKYPIIKHDFLLNQGIDYLKSLMPTATFFPTNLFYFVNNDRCETDGLIIYDKVLFIIEAKGNRITLKAKGGYELKTKDHLKDIIKDSYSQGIRTLKHIEGNTIAEFKTKKGKRVEINKNDFDDIIIVSLTIEPIGNLSMTIKATNEIGYFNDGHFPWIISIYDLIVLADLFENPFILIHYIKRRKQFLSNKLLSTHDELDLVSYFLGNGLYIENALKDAKEKNINWIEFAPNTDAINDYYMYKFGHKTKFTTKPKFYISKEFNNFLLQIDNSKLPHRVRIALLLLEFNNKSINQIMNLIKKTKAAFSKDKKLHDCTIYTYSMEGLGITFMTATDKHELDFQLYKYCNYKLHQQNSNAWIGLGDVSSNPNVFNFQSMFFVMRKEITESKRS